MRLRGVRHGERHRVRAIAERKIERGSEHPLAAAIVGAADARALGSPMPNLLPPSPLGFGETRPGVSDFRSATGKGVSARAEGRAVDLGTVELMRERGVDAAPFAARADVRRRDGETVVFVAVDGGLAGMIAVADPIRPSAVEAVRALEAEGVSVIMLSGDNQVTANAIARQLGIDEVRAGVLPGGKRAVVEELQRAGRLVAMAGDGVNDAPALAQATVGIAMGTGTDVAIESAGITLVKSDLRGIVRARRLSRGSCSRSRAS